MRAKFGLTALALVLCTTAAVLMNYPRPASAFDVSICSKIENEKGQREYQLGKSRERLKFMQEHVAQMKTRDPVIVNRKLGAALQVLSAYRDKLARSTPDERKTWQSFLKLAEIQVAFWRERQTDLLTEGSVHSHEGAAFAAYMNEEVNKLHADVEFQRNQLAMLRRELRTCAAARAETSPQQRTHWSGSYAEGADVIVVSGGAGNLSFMERRHTESEDWHRGGSCVVHGSEATCTWSAHFHDTGKDVEYTGHGKLILYTDSISYDFVQDTGTITLADGQPCPNINECTGLHPGAVSTGTWTRKH